MEPQTRLPPTLLTSSDMIEALTRANSRPGDVLQQYLLREALRALVRLAKAEKLLELKRDVALSVGLRLPTLRLPRSER